MPIFNRSILGLDIGSHSLKLVEIKQTRGGPIITRAKAIPIEREEDSYTEIGKSLRKLLDMAKVRAKDVVTSVSSSEEEVIMRPMFIPEMTADVSEDAVRTSARFEAEDQDYIPYDVDNALMNFDIIGETTVDDQKGLEIFFVSAHKDLIENRIQLLEEVGLRLIAIDVDNLAVTRLLEFTGQINDDENIAIIDIGASKTSLCFYKYGKPYVYPHIPIAGDSLTSELSQQFQISWQRAEEYKKLKGSFKNSHSEEKVKFSFETEIEDSLNSSASVDSPTASAVEESSEYSPHEVFAVLQDVFEKNDGLFSQLQNRFEYYYEANLEKPSKIIVSGGTSQLASLDEFMTSRFSIPIEKISYLEKIPIDAKEDVHDIEENEPLFATAVGLALKRKL